MTNLVELKNVKKNYGSKEAVKVYHAHLKKNKIPSERSLKKDLEITQENLKD